MAKFYFSAVGADDGVVTGDIDAGDIDDAYRQLALRGMRLIRVTIGDARDERTDSLIEAHRASPRSAARKPLSTDDSLLLAEHLEALAKSGLPLAPGLRAAAEELSDRRLSATLVDFAEQLEMGRSLEEILAGQPRMVSTPVACLIEAGVRSGRLADGLAQLLEIDRSTRDPRRTVRLAISYPALLLAGFIVLVVFVGLFVVPDLETVYNDFHVQIPLSTGLLFWFSGKRMVVAVGIALAAVPLLILMLRAAMSPVMESRVLARIPFLGPILVWRAVAHWTRLLGLFVEQSIPVPEALRLASDGTSHAGVALDSRALAQAVSMGYSMADAIVAVTRLPQSLAPIVRRGEDTGTLADSLRTAGDMFENRVRLRVTLLESVLPPVLFVVVAMGAIGLLNAIISPMIDLMTNLSGQW